MNDEYTVKISVDDPYDDYIYYNRRHIGYDIHSSIFNTEAEAYLKTLNLFWYGLNVLFMKQITEVNIFKNNVGYRNIKNILYRDMTTITNNNLGSLRIINKMPKYILIDDKYKEYIDIIDVNNYTAEETLNTILFFNISDDDLVRLRLCSNNKLIKFGL